MLIQFIKPLITINTSGLGVQLTCLATPVYRFQTVLNTPDIEEPK